MQKLIAEQRGGGQPGEGNLSILPSESQVMSARVALSVGSSSSLCRGMMGNSWSIAHMSGADLKTAHHPTLRPTSLILQSKKKGSCTCTIAAFNQVLIALYPERRDLRRPPDKVAVQWHLDGQVFKVKGPLLTPSDRMDMVKI